LLVAHEGLTVLDGNIDSESYDLRTLTGGLDTVGQIQICGSPATARFQTLIEPPDISDTTIWEGVLSICCLALIHLSRELFTQS
jgi:hypothetical protein